MVRNESGWAVERSGSLILVTLKGSLHGTDGFHSASRCVELMDGDKVCLVGDLFDLQRYESRVRIDWQDVISQHTERFSFVYAAASSPLVRMGVTTFGLFARIPTRTFKTRNGLERALTNEHAMHVRTKA